ncbi:MAG: hypothetical protein JSW28_04230 [Thermoplasmata archaeon]|nr:MAG: hypothetical protein JSW28_04230 [Thermoplasmata archaeon]
MVKRINRTGAIKLEEKEAILMDKEIEHLANYIRLVKKIYIGALIVLIVLFASFIFVYGLELFRNIYVTGLFIITIMVLYLISMILLFNFRRKVRRLKDKL